METKLNLYQKIQAVSNEVMNIEKDMTVGSGSYSYKAVSDNAVTLQVKKAETKYNLLSIPIKQECVHSEVLKVVKNGKESIVHINDIKMTLRIIDLDKVEDFVDIESYGKGLDNGDKGFGKASTYARKYALLNAYKIATGEDPDAEKSEDVKTVTIDKKKVAVLDACLRDEILQHNVLSHFGVTSTTDLTDENIGIVYNQWKAKNII